MYKLDNTIAPWYGEEEVFIVDMKEPEASERLRAGRESSRLNKASRLDWARRGQRENRRVRGRQREKRTKREEQNESSIAEIAGL